MQFLRKGFFAGVLLLAAYGAFQWVPQAHEAVDAVSYTHLTLPTTPYV